MNIEEARKVIKEEEEGRIKSTITALDVAHKENNTDHYVTMEIVLFGQIVKIDSRMLPHDKTILNIVSK